MKRRTTSASKHPKCPCGCNRSPCVMVRRPGESQDDHDERVREAVDEAMLANPVLAHIPRTDPLSNKYKAGLLRPVTKART